MHSQTSGISSTWSQNFVVFAKSSEDMIQVEDEDIAVAAPTGDAPTTSEWSTILLPTKMQFILEV